MSVEHLLRRGGDVDLLERDAERLGQPGGVRAGRVPRREARHREGVDVAARAAQPVHRARRDDQRVGRVEAAADADHHLGRRRCRTAAARARRPGCCRPRSSRARAARGRRARTGTGRPCVAARCRRRGGCELELDACGTPRSGRRRCAGCRRRCPGGCRSWRMPVEVDVGDRHPRAVGEPVALGEQVAALVDHRLAVPATGRSSTRPGPRPRRRTPRCSARSTLTDQQGAVLGARDRDRAAGQVGQHGGAGQVASALGGIGTHMSSQISTCSLRSGHVGRAEDQVRTERHPPVGHADRRTAAVVARREVPPLVELPVGRQVGLGRDAQDHAAVDDHRAVEDPGAVDQRCADDQHRPQRGGRGDHLGDRRVRGVEQRVLEQQVVDGVAGQAQLREHRDRDAVLVGLLGHRDDLRRVGRGVGDGHGQRARRDPREPVRVRRVEVHTSSLGAGRSRSYR